MDARIRILCADDHRLMREGIARTIALQDDMTLVAEAPNGEEAIRQFARHRPDVTLMDLQMPRLNGLDAITAIRQQRSDARIIVLTMYHGDEDIYRAVRAGAVAYLLKDAAPEQLVACVRDVHAGQRVLPPEIVAALDARSSAPSLTQRELQVLELLAAGRRTKEIAAELGISGDTASEHVKGIFLKFRVHDRTAALAEAVRRGIIHLR